MLFVDAILFLLVDTDLSTFTKYGLGISAGLGLMIWAFESFDWHKYMRVNPQTGSVSGSGIWLYYPVFMLGAVIAFTV